MSFSGDMRRFVAKTASAHNTITRVATLELFSGIVKGNPVDTGRSRGAWTTSVGVPGDSPERLDKTGAQAIAEIGENTPAGAGQVTLLSNSLPYIFELEEGSSKQAPEGFVRKNMDRVERMVDAAIRKHRV